MDPVDETTAGAEAAEVAAEVRLRFAPFLRECVIPGAAERDRAAEPVSEASFRRAAELGLLDHDLPRELGGHGEDLLRWGAALEELGFSCEDTSFAAVVSTRAAVARAIWEAGDRRLAERYARPMARGARAGAFCYSDDGDAFHLSTTVRREGDVHVVDGRKYLVTGGTGADTFMTYARDERGDVQVLLVERGDRGLEVAPAHAMGMRTAGLAIVTYRDVRVPDDRMLVRDDGVSHAQHFLNRRVLLTAPYLGAARAMLGDCVASLSERHRHGRPLASQQAVQALLGRMFASLAASRLLLYAVLDGMRRAAPGAALHAGSSLAKYVITEHLQAIARCALDLQGGRGYLAGERYERFARDVAGLIAGGGTQRLLETNLGELALGQFRERPSRPAR